MRTPAGKDCPYYYADYYRGRTTQECRLLTGRADSLPWEPRVCSICPLPAIVQANHCPVMTLQVRLVRRWLRRRVVVTAYCTRYKVEVENPYVGCGRCHPEAAAIFVEGSEHVRGDSAGPG